MEDSDVEFVVGLTCLFNCLRALTSPWTSQPSSTVCRLINVFFGCRRNRINHLLVVLSRRNVTCEPLLPFTVSCEAGETRADDKYLQGKLF